ncbi:unnamed protein product [Sphagnum troendelagicum]|uniref:C2H2-type domain-containing protein n=1 Tax=Sphagnum troendelagicum TaxID=128251 RepID=A0ABP0UHI7_9BRYO
MIPPVMDFASLFEEIEFTPLQDPRLERYTTSPPLELLPVVPGITVVNGYRCKADGCAYYSATRKTMGNHRHANHFFLPIHASRQPCQVQRLFRKVGYTAYFGVDHQNMELAGDSVGLQLKEQVHSRDNNPVDDKPFVNVLGNLHSDIGDALDNFVSYIRGRQDADMDDEDLVRVHTVLLHICRPPTCQVVQQEPQIACPIMRFLIVSSLKLDPSSTNLAFEHVRHVRGHVAILQYWWRCTILMQLVRPTWQPDHLAVPWCEVDEWLACVRDNAKDTPFNRLRETMRLSCMVLGDGSDIPKLVRIGPMACTIDGQAITIDTLRNLVGALLCEANKVMNNQLLLGL